VQAHLLPFIIAPHVQDNRDLLLAASASRAWSTACAALPLPGLLQISNQRAEDVAEQLLRLLPRVQELELSCITGCLDSALVLQAPQLTRLIVRKCELSNGLDNCPGLRTLHLSNVSGHATLRACTRLEQLALSDVAGGVAILAADGSHRLGQIDVTSAPPAAVSFPVHHSLDGLTSLEIGTKEDDTGNIDIGGIAALKSLRRVRLDLGGTQLDGVQALEALTSLTSLHLCNFTPAQVKLRAVSQMRGLVELFAHNCRLPPDVCGLPALRDLSTSVADVDVRRLGELASLTALRLEGIREPTTLPTALPLLCNLGIIMVLEDAESALRLSKWVHGVAAATRARMRVAAFCRDASVRRLAGTQLTNAARWDLQLV
jgi:hypothetical protein